MRKALFTVPDIILADRIRSNDTYDNYLQVTFDWQTRL